MNHWQKILDDDKRKAPVKREANKQRQRKKRERDGRTQHKILACLECAWVFDRRLTGCLCPECGSKHLSPAGKVYGNAAYSYQFSQTPHKRLKQVKRLMKLAEEGEL